MGLSTFGRHTQQIYQRRWQLGNWGLPGGNRGVSVQYQLPLPRNLRKPLGLDVGTGTHSLDNSRRFRRLQLPEHLSGPLRASALPLPRDWKKSQVPHIGPHQAAEA